VAIHKSYNNRYSDGLAQKKRRRFFIKIFIILGSSIIAIACVVYSLFFSSLMQITDITISGAKTVNPDDINSIVRSEIDKTYGPLSVKLRKNILFFDQKTVRDKILSDFPVIKTVEIQKILPHEIKIIISERNPQGTWCTPDKCRYFDREGIKWGSALRSSGSILLAVDDFRTEDKDGQGRLFMESIEEIAVGLEKLKIKIEKVEIPSNSIGNFKVHTAGGYYLVFTVDSSIEKQLETLKIFLENRTGDSAIQYIDVSIEGRAYYR
jgi:hypothetical protein